ncbi:hypothetical protein [Streptomyces litmocidini]|uniref:hypothetical protein n=1 Tax=Streptomyces litmocidini TaxID=67318 RepID=UPI00167E9498|nr:hypothetical protein [Streptomyces litmocidini]
MHDVDQRTTDPGNPYGIAPQFALRLVVERQEVPTRHLRGCGTALGTGDGTEKSGHLCKPPVDEILNRLYLMQQTVGSHPIDRPLARMVQMRVAP